jgi:hypothetical protein
MRAETCYNLKQVFPQARQATAQRRTIAKDAPFAPFDHLHNLEGEKDGRSPMGTLAHGLYFIGERGQLYFL